MRGIGYFVQDKARFLPIPTGVSTRTRGTDEETDEIDALSRPRQSHAGP